MSYSPESYTHSKEKIQVLLDFSNHAIKSDSKTATSIDASKFATEAENLASLKSYWQIRSW